MIMSLVESSNSTENTHPSKLELFRRAANEFVFTPISDNHVNWEIAASNVMYSHALKTNTPIYKAHSGEITSRGYTIKGTQSVHEWAVRNNYNYVGEGMQKRILLDDNGMVLSFLRIYDDAWEIWGPEDLVNDFFQVAKDSFEPIEFLDNAAAYLELSGFDHQGQPKIHIKEMTHQYDLHDEFYPYLAGGFEALIRDFIQSDESILILGGVPGTGKSIGMKETMINLGLQPIVAQDAQAILHPDFITTIFSLYSKMYEQNVVKKEKTVYDSEWNRDIHDVIQNTFPVNKSRHGRISQSNDPDTYSVMSFGGPYDRTATTSGITYSRDDKDDDFTITAGELATLPIIFVEDADQLLLALTEGNLMIQNLRNRTDGISKEHPVKVVFTTNRDNEREFDEALLRDGRCYGFMNFRSLTPNEAVIARKTAGLPDFEEPPTESMALATALRKPRKKIFLDGKTRRYGFTGSK